MTDAEREAVSRYNLAPDKPGFTPSLGGAWVLYSDYAALADRLEAVEAENADLQATFDATWDANMRGAKIWQEITGRENTLPDQVDMVVTLLTCLATETSRAEAAETKARESALSELSALGQAMDAYDAQVAAEARAYKLAVAIMGGEDAPGYADSIDADVLADQVRKERADQSAWVDACVKIEQDKLAKAVEALRECQAEIDDYVRNEYPGDHPVHERYRKRDFSANPARIALAALAPDD